MFRTRRIVLVVETLALVVVIGCWFQGMGNAEGQTPYRVIQVQSGDTLWGLARKHGDPRRDVRETITVIRDVNGLKESDLLPGQKLKVPMSVKEEAPND
ncbi:LysM repeat protein [Kroppenstedtia sanguinis]|uniref:LysM peptidoglycan-binding domain-containing protein n=1 Tax=Kroppenstedtia sanguinis TaxID=1380684 RepID=UPI003D25772D